jgi:pimeloyl-ACP methyl ester carboxylesterase
MADGVVTPSRPAAWRERPLSFGRSRSLVGIVTEPTVVRGIPVVILGAGILHRMGPSRASVHLARALASAGHPTVRFDLSGIGDSSRAAEANLAEAVVADIHDAIELATAAAAGTPWNAGVALVGYCSGADNAFFVAADDPRVRTAVLFDPTIHRTAGFRRRDLLRRLTSRESWFNVISGRSLRLRIAQRLNSASVVRAPDHYGLLVAGREDADRRAHVMRERGVRLQFLLSSGVRSYCNSPAQVRESLAQGFSPELFEVVWAPHVDHVFSRARHIEWLSETVIDWLSRCGQHAPGPADAPSTSGG